MKVIPNAGIIVQTVEHEAGYKRLEQETDVTPEELQVIQRSPAMPGEELRWKRYSKNWIRFRLS